MRPMGRLACKGAAARPGVEAATNNNDNNSSSSSSSKGHDVSQKARQPRSPGRSTLPVVCFCLCRYKGKIDTWYLLTVVYLRAGLRGPPDVDSAIAQAPRRRLHLQSGQPGLHSLRAAKPTPTMRPLSGGDGPSAARPPSRNAGAPSSHVPTTFFMRSAEDVEHRETPFGVQSLADHLEAALDSKHIPLARRSLSRPSHESSPPSQPSQSPKPSHQHSSSDHLPHYTLPASTHHTPDGPVLADPASFPQLVMPSIQMPSRRPFTTKGKAMGKLKVLLAGQAGMSFAAVVL